MADSAADADVLRSQRYIRRALDWRPTPMWPCWAWNLDPSQSGFAKGRLSSAEELTALKADGAVGDLGGHILLEDGRLHNNPYQERMIPPQPRRPQAYPQNNCRRRWGGQARCHPGVTCARAPSPCCHDDRTAGSVLELQEAGRANEKQNDN